MINEDAIFIYDRPFKKGLKFWVKRVLLVFLGVFYRVVLYFNKPQKLHRKYDVVICAIFKNEARFFKEWIEYHKVVGVCHFYLYNNFSEDNYLEVLQPYIDCGEVTLIDWPVPQGQSKAYEHWFKNYKNECQWVSFLDLDEFICPLQHQTIGEWVNAYSNYPSVVVYWKMFGTSGLMEHNNSKLVVEQYHICWGKSYAVGKMLYNTCFNIAKFDIMVHHMPQTKVSFFGVEIIIPPINEFYFFLQWNIHRVKSLRRNECGMQINHYWSKAFDFYMSKQNRGDVAFQKSPLNLDYFFWHETKNCSSDYSIYRFLVKLKLQMRLKHNE